MEVREIIKKSRERGGRVGPWREAAIAKTLPASWLNNSNLSVLEKLNLIIQSNRKAPTRLDLVTMTAGGAG